MQRRRGAWGIDRCPPLSGFCVEPGMEAIVVSRVESRAAEPAGSARGAPDSPRLRLHLLGPMVITRGGAALALPPSRKVRALIAYLALAPRAIARGALTEL